MEKQDYLQKQIDELGAALRKFLEIILNTKNTGNSSTDIIELFRKELNIKLDILLSNDNTSLEEIIEDKKFNENNLELLSKIFIETAELLYSENKQLESKLFYQRSLFIYEYIDKKTSSYSVIRQTEVEKIRNILNTNF